jgi:dolichol-phosphate mannosyltransferase
MYNEVDNVEPFVTEIHGSLKDCVTNYEIIVVDDGSTDGTGERLIELMHSVPTLRALRHDGNFGQSSATLTGIRHAKHPWIVTMDGDAQNDPHDIPLLLAELEKQPSLDHPMLIAGNRKKRNDSTIRKISSRVGNGVRNAILKDDCMDTGCSLKLFSKELFLSMPHFNHLHRFIPSLIKRAGGTIINVPVNHRPRTRGTSKYGVMNRLWVGIVDLFGVRWLMSRPCNPKTLDEKSN